MYIHTSLRAEHCSVFRVTDASSVVGASTFKDCSTCQPNRRKRLPISAILIGALRENAEISLGFIMLQSSSRFIPIFFTYKPRFCAEEM